MEGKIKTARISKDNVLCPMCYFQCGLADVKRESVDYLTSSIKFAMRDKAGLITNWLGAFEVWSRQVMEVGFGNPKMARYRRESTRNLKAEAY